MTSAPLLVEAHLSTPVIGVDRQPMMLDAPLSWAYAARAGASGERLPALTNQFAADFPLPLDRWEQDAVWGWCTSRATWDIRQYVAAQIRRKPATDAMTRYTPLRKHHAALGPTKARDTTIDALLATSVSWRVLCTNRDDLENLLTLVTNLGGRVRNNFGHVTSWTITDDTDRDGWRDRPMPTPGVEIAVRAPYWHPSRKITLPC